MICGKVCSAVSFRVPMYLWRWVLQHTVLVKHYYIQELCQAVSTLAAEVLCEGGVFLCKVLQGTQTSSKFPHSHPPSHPPLLAPPLFVHRIDGFGLKHTKSSCDLCYIMHSRLCEDTKEYLQRCERMQSKGNKKRINRSLCSC